jgi:hypothetical protein
MNRREIMRMGLRGGGLSALALLASALGLRSLRNKDCRKASPCGACPLFAGCDLPKARQGEAGTARKADADKPETMS